MAVAPMRRWPCRRDDGRNDELATSDGNGKMVAATTRCREAAASHPELHESFLTGSCKSRKQKLLPKTQPKGA
ncbi:hypothetical protein GUJ93_ZPchr0012g22180 [Zizania palustris]|uniref:Uncharacterized protein n=1 Tax=Zizania palustris TaxID=103762 RepID=A0A8J6BW70_ZIZPA|nr:hypothetical protein GUJ93_ZPchr0012g22180 [Zizania palustris]